AASTAFFASSTDAWIAAMSRGSLAASPSSAAIRLSRAWRSINVRSSAFTSSSVGTSWALSSRSPSLGTRTRSGGPTWTRTKTGPVMSRGLCQLSYGPGRHDNTGSGLEEAPELLGTRGMAEFAQRLRFDLADALSRDGKILADLLEGVLAAVGQP